jgi:hypothetical protein
MNPQWLEVDGKMIGVSLGADFTAEHEHGIGDLKLGLGIDGAARSFYTQEEPLFKRPPGIQRRKISKHDMVKLYEHEGLVALIGERPGWHLLFDEYVKKHGMTKAMKEKLPLDLRGFSAQTLAAAWDEGSFGLLGSGEDGKRLKELAEAFQKDNVAVWIGGSLMAFDNGGLILCIVDRIPAAKLEMLREADLDLEKLKKADRATGIHERLKKAGREYYACSPRWFDGKFRPNNEEKKSAHPVIYWLNPRDQDENNFGWYTVEDLDLWILGKGPIPKQKVEQNVSDLGG